MAELGLESVSIRQYSHTISPIRHIALLWIQRIDHVILRGLWDPSLYLRERDIKKDKAYAELEKKCNEALQDLDKNPLVSDMRVEIETLQS
ncbi:hypothetical protein Tco_0671881 [Tanacetum coccineum]